MGVSVKVESTHSVTVSVLRSTKNEGRSQAVNRGINLSSSKYVWVIDADCVLDSEDHFERVVACFNQGFDFCVGRTIASGDDFWSRYHNEVAIDRTTKNEFIGYTTACFAANREKLLKVGGFNSEYRYYGLEDKDLIVTLVAEFGSKSLYSEPQLTAIHNDQPTLKSVTRKFNQAGRFSAPIFMGRHKNLYKKLVYSRYDPRLISPVRQVLLRAIAPFIRSFLPLAPYCLANRLVPYSIKKLIVQSLCAVAYFYGGRGLEWPKS